MTRVRTQEDAQFSTHYVLALTALGIPLDAKCQDRRLFADPRVKNMMSRIERDVHPEALDARRSDPATYLARVEITMNDGSRFTRETRYAKGTVKAGFRMTDTELVEKARRNFSTRMRSQIADAAADRLFKLDAISNISSVIDRLN